MLLKGARNPFKSLLNLACHAVYTRLSAREVCTGYNFMGSIYYGMVYIESKNDLFGIVCQSGRTRNGIPRSKR